MPKRVIPILVLMTLLLAGCQFPKTLEEAIHWNDLFFIHDESALMNLLGPLSSILVALSGLIAATGIVGNLKNGRNPLGGMYMTGMTLLMASGIFRHYIPIATAFGKFMLGDLTIDQVMQLMSWEWTANPVELGVIGTAMVFTIFLPAGSALWELVMAVISGVVLIGSVFSANVKGAIFATAQLIGWGLYLWLYRSIVVAIGQYYQQPNMELLKPLTSPGINAIYIGASIILMAVCYFLLPWLASKNLGGYIQQHTTTEQNVEVNNNPVKKSTYVKRVTKKVAGMANTYVVEHFDLSDANNPVNRIKRRSS